MIEKNGLYRRARYLVAALALLGLAPLQSAFSQTANDTFEVSIVIANTCTITANDLSFGSQTAIASAVTAQSTIVVNCSNTTAYTVSLDTGVNGNRFMSNGSQTVDYELYTSAGRTTVWGTNAGVNTVGGTGSGGNQTLTVYGTVPGQTTPNPATYTDTITATIAF